MEWYSDDIVAIFQVAMSEVLRLVGKYQRNPVVAPIFSLGRYATRFSSQALAMAHNPFRGSVCARR